jgi:hypothetical protein
MPSIPNSFGAAVAIASAALITAPAPAQSIQFVRGPVEFVRSHDAATNPAWAPPRSWVTLKGVQAAADCPTFGNSVLFVMNDKALLSMALASQMAGRSLAIAFDPTQRVNGFCVVAWMTTGDPPPLY